MYYAPRSSAPYYRVTGRGVRRADVLSGMGSYYNLGGRYNRIHQRTVYASDDVLVSITETAFSQAKQWQERIGGGQTTTPLPPVRPAPPTYPLISYHTLWCFTLKVPPKLVDIDHLMAYPVFHHDPIQILNPGQFYESTQGLADRIRASLDQPSSNPQGIRAPSVRTPATARYQPCQFALFVFGGRLRGQIDWCADLTLEFLDTAGKPVDHTTKRVDWVHPRFMLRGLSNPIPAFAARPGSRPYREDTWSYIVVEY
jgi:RES domain-containing protein